VNRQFSFVILVAIASFTFAADPPKKPEVDPELAAIAAKLKDKNPKVRLKAVEDLAALGDKAAPVAEAVCDATMDPSGSIGLAALAAIEKIRPDLYKPLVDLLIDKDSKKNTAAITTLRLMGEDALPAINLLSARMKAAFAQTDYGANQFGPRVGKSSSLVSPYDFGKEYLSTIEAIKPDHESIKAIRLQLAKPTNHVFSHRFECLKALIDGAGGDEAEKKKLLPLVVVGLQQDPKRTDPRHTAIYLEYVGQFGKLAAGQLPALKKMKLSTVDSIRDAATKAVDQIEADR